jgi:hypothetical protein
MLSSLPFLLLLAPSPARAAGCTEMGLARVESARLLLAEAPEVPDIDRASLVERAIILLERTLEAEASCADARSVLKDAQKLLKKVTPVSVAADFEAAVAQASARLQDAEASHPRDPEEIETLRFMIASLLDIKPQDTRLLALARRAAALRGE